MSYKKNILLVEDDHNFGSILNDYLKLHSYKTTLARNGVEGLEKFKKQIYDIIGLVFSGLFVFWIVCLFGCVCVCVCVCVGACVFVVLLDDFGKTT